MGKSAQRTRESIEDTWTHSSVNAWEITEDSVLEVNGSVTIAMSPERAGIGSVQNLWRGCKSMNLIEEFKHDSSGLAIINEWLGSGAHPVSCKNAPEKRAEACFNLPAECVSRDGGKR